MRTLRLVGSDDPPPLPAPRPRLSRLIRWLLVGATLVAGTILCTAWWWVATTDARALRALPDQQRIPLYQRTVETLRNVCDPAPGRSMRDFCRRQAEIAIAFRECDASPACQELARRHLSQPHR
jgi:hypothetical protein